MVVSAFVKKIIPYAGIVASAIPMCTVFVIFSGILNKNTSDGYDDGITYLTKSPYYNENSKIPFKTDLDLYEKDKVWRSDRRNESDLKFLKAIRGTENGIKYLYVGDTLSNRSRRSKRDSSGRSFSSIDVNRSVSSEQMDKYLGSTWGYDKDMFAVFESDYK